MASSRVHTSNCVHNSMCNLGLTNCFSAFQIVQHRVAYSVCKQISQEDSKVDDNQFQACSTTLNLSKPS